MDVYKSAYRDIMKEHHICFNCAFWQDRIDTPPYSHEVIGGKYYIVNPSVRRPINRIKGGRGMEYYIRRNDGTLIKTNNLWFQGEIPKQFRDRLPDTARFITLMGYQKLKKDPQKCTSRGCWDRYHCARYDKSCEKGGPWNVIPKNHHPGDENCPSFVNKSKIFL